MSSPQGKAQNVDYAIPRTLSGTTCRLANEADPMSSLAHIGHRFGERMHAAPYEQSPRLHVVSASRHLITHGAIINCT